MAGTDAGGTPYVFISYAGGDRDRVLPVAEVVRALGVAVRLDRADGPGDATATTGSERSGVVGCAALLLMCSDAALADPTVTREIQLAWHADRPILPVLLDPVLFPEEFDYWLEGAQWIEVLGRPPERWLPALTRALIRAGALAPTTYESGASPTPAGLDPLAGVPTNLPPAGSPLVGRERELTQVRSLLDAARLVTLTGGGGVGKTRLALEAARSLGPLFPDGVWLVDLAPVTVAAAVPGVIAAALGVREAGGQSPREAVAAYLAGRTALLVLDNLEQIPAAGAVVAGLLDAGPDVRVLTTSRAPLRTAGERAFPVPPLAAPDRDPARLPPLPLLAENPSVRLFVTRAAAARPGFTLTEGNAAAVAAICARLDGLPLALELAAARIRLLPPAALLTRLGDRLDLLTAGGSEARPGRHRTLRATLAWSYDLLTPPEQTLFRHLSIFAGGASLTALEAVSRGVEESRSRGEDDPLLDSVLDSVEALLDHGLLASVAAGGEDEDGESRVTQLETIRGYAGELLAAAGEEAAARAAHATHFAALARNLAPDLTGSAQAAALARLAADHANLGAALDWLTERGGEAEGGRGGEGVVAGLRLATDLWRFWWVRGHVQEGHDQLERALAAGAHAPPEIRLPALNAAGILAETRGDAALATTRYEAALAIAQDLGDPTAAALALDNLGLVAAAAGDFAQAVARYDAAHIRYQNAGNERGIATVLHHQSTVALNQGDLDRAAAQAGESLARWRALSDPHGVGFALQQLGVIAQLQGDFARSTERYDEAVALSRSLGDVPGTASGLLNLGHAAERQGDLDRAGARFDEALAIYHDLGDQGGIAYTEWSQGDLARARGDLPMASRLLTAALDRLRQFGEQETIALCLESLAAVAIGQGDPAQAAILLGAAEARRAAVGVPVPPTREAEYAHDLAAIRAALSPEDREAARNIGRVMSLDQILTEIRNP